MNYNIITIEEYLSKKESTQEVKKNKLEPENSYHEIKSAFDFLISSVTKPK